MLILPQTFTTSFMYWLEPLVFSRWMHGKEIILKRNTNLIWVQERFYYFFQEISSIEYTSQYLFLLESQEILYHFWYKIVFFFLYCIDILFILILHPRFFEADRLLIKASQWSAMITVVKFFSQAFQQAPIECNRIQRKQESIQVGRLPPACQLYMFWWPPLGDSTGGDIPAPMVYPSPRHTHPLWTYPQSHPGHTHPLDLHPLDIPTSLLVRPDGHDWKHTPMDRATDRQLWKYYLPTTSLAGGNNVKYDIFARKSCNPNKHTNTNRPIETNRLFPCLNIAGNDSGTQPQDVIFSLHISIGSCWFHDTVDR